LCRFCSYVSCSPVGLDFKIVASNRQMIPEVEQSIGHFESDVNSFTPD
jgi:hypothetical protein